MSTMKRQGDRDSPSRVKKYRARSPFNHRSYRDHSPNVRESRYNPRDARRNIAPSRYRSPVRSPRYSPPVEPARTRRNYREADDTYRTLLVRNFSTQLLKQDIQESLEYEFQRFGKVSVKVTRDYNGERVAYATFRDPDDAKDCKNAKGHLVMHDRRLAISVFYEDQAEERPSPKYRSPFGRDADYSPARRRSPVIDRSPPPRRRSPKQMSLRGRTPPKERYQSRDRSSYNDRFSPRPRMPARDKRGSDDQSPRNSLYSSRERGSSRDDSPPVRSRSFSGDRSPVYNGSQSRDRGRSKSSDSSGDKKADSPAKDKDTTSTPNVSTGFESNSFSNPGFVDKSIPPEDDPFATRTLFVGNLEADVASYDLARIFEEFGDITDIDVKRAGGGQGAYAFVKYANLNQAYKAKVNLNGKAILTGTNVRIGYGKVIVSSKIWVGGLGDWTTLSDLEREFDRFGSIRRIDFRRGDDSATIAYETIDAAQAASNQMRGFLMPNAETRLRIDFISPDHGTAGKEGYSHWGRHENKSYDNHGQNYGSSNDRYSGNKYKNNNSRYRGRNVFNDDRKADRRNRGSRSPGGRYEKESKPKKSSIHETAMTELQLKRMHAKSCYSLHDLCQVFDPPCWQGGFVLKKIAFPVLFFMLEGDMGIFNTTTADPNSATGRQTMFHVTKRMRMTDEKVKEVSRRMKYCEGKSCLIVAVPGVPENLNMSGTVSGPMPTQHKPLRGLVKYFKDKNAAAIISVPLINSKSKDDDGDSEKSKEKEVSGYIHAFAPGSFATEQLLKIGPSLQPSFFADEYMVAVLVKGSTSALL